MSRSNERVAPPHVLEGWLRRCLPAGAVGSCIIGDLREEYAAIARAQSERHANRWYRGQACSLAPRYLLAKLGRKPRAPGRLPRRTSMGGKAMGTILQDLRHAARALLKKPGFALTVISIVALGVGATTTIFSVVENVLLTGLPYPKAEQLVFFDNPAHPVPLYLDWRDRTSSFSSIAAAWDDSYDLTGDGTPESVRGALITRDFFQMLGAAPQHGRLLTADDFVGMPPRVAVLSNGIWQRRWGADTSIVGHTITLSGYPVEIVGVLDQRFQPPGPVTGSRVDVWMPLDVSQESLQSRNLVILSVVARLRSGVRLEAAQADLDALSTALADEYPTTNRQRDGSPRLYRLSPLLDATVGDFDLAISLLFGAVGLMLLIACANVANLFLAKGAEQVREIAVRAALGASRRRVASQLLTESVAVAVAGGAVGVALAVIGVRAFEAFYPGGIPRVESVHLNARVLAFALALSAVTGVLFGIAPAIRASREDVTKVLNEAGAAVTQSRGAAGLRSSLVVAEIAMALMLLVGAGLLFHSFLMLRNVDTGFSTKNVTVMPLMLPDHYSEQQRLDFGRDLLNRIAAIPGVVSAGAGSTVPPTAGFMCCWGEAVRGAEEVENPPMTIVHPITPGYFDALGVRVLRGRGFTPADNETTSAPAIVNETAARFLFGEDDPLGKSIFFAHSRWTVVGVVADVRHWGLQRVSGHNVYVPHAIFGGGFGSFQVAVKSGLDAATLAAGLREAVWAVDPNISVSEITSLDEVVQRSIGEPRFYSGLLITFATLAILLAAGGIYGSMLYSVGQRYREMGIRMALGAGVASVVAMILRSGLILTTIGVALGLGGALALSRVLESVLFGIAPTDPITYVAATLLLGAVALVACYVPARKAAEADPIETLRAE